VLEAVVKLWQASIKMGNASRFRNSSGGWSDHL